MSEVQGLIYDFFCKNFNVSEFDMDCDIFQAGLVNSLFAIQIVSFLEEKFAIQFANEDLKVSHFNTINHIDAFVSQKLESCDV